jgi:hypothetical protein
MVELSTYARKIRTGIVAGLFYLLTPVIFLTLCIVYCLDKLPYADNPNAFYRWISRWFRVGLGGFVFRMLGWLHNLAGLTSEVRQ